MHTEYESAAISPETRLWKAVLWRAFDDLFYLGIEHSLVVAKSDSKKWFFKKGFDFNHVCWFADYKPEYVFDKFKKLKQRKEYEFTKSQTIYLKQRKKYLNDNRRRFQGL